jgi:sugar/nucleoside kinase (ribokinase family)
VVDVFVSGLLFYDLVFTGLRHAPVLGTELWTKGSGTGPGGIANFAVTLARLNLSTSLSAAFGDDDFGRICWDALERGEGIDLSRSRRLDGWPTPVTVSLAYDGDRALVTHGEPIPVSADDLIGTPPASRAAIVHVGWDPSQEWSRDMLDQLAHCHAFLPNEEEAMAYTRTSTPRAAVIKLAEHVPLAVVTCGRDGAYAIDGETGEHAWAPALEVDAVDPTGAGDVFGASLVAGTLAGWALADRLRFAALCAGLSVQRIGGAPAAPDWPGIARWWHATHDAQLRKDYAFLDQVLAQGGGS